MIEQFKITDIGRGKIMVVFLAVLAVIAVGFVLKLAEAVILPLIIAWLLSYLLGPVIKVMTKRKVPTPLAVAFVLVLLLGGCYLGGRFLYARVIAFVNAYPGYEDRLSELIETYSRRWRLAELGPDLDWGREIGRFLVRLSGSLVSFMSSLFMVMIFLIFLLLGKPYSGYKLRKALSPERADQVSDILGSISRDIGGYLSVQLLISFVTAVLVWGALALLDVDFAVTWGALAFFLNFIPTIGSIIASIPPILLAVVQFYPDIWPRPVFAMLFLLAIQMVMGNFIAPKAMGERLNLSPVVVMLSLVFWGWLWGITGALLAVPLASAMKIVCETRFAPGLPYNWVNSPPIRSASNPFNAPFSDK